MDPDPTSLNLQEPERLDRSSIIGSKVGTLSGRDY